MVLTSFRDLCCLVGSGEPTAVQQAFLDVVLGDEGQKTVEDMGFIPMN